MERSMNNELITYDMLKASLKVANVPFNDIWNDYANQYIVSFCGVNDTFVFYFYEDGTLKSIDNYD